MNEKALTRLITKYPSALIKIKFLKNIVGGGNSGSFVNIKFIS